MEFQIPINTLFTQVFGIAGPLIRKFTVPPKEEGRTNLNPTYKFDIEPQEIRENQIFNSLGIPIQFAMSIEGGYDFLVRRKGELVKENRKGMYFPFTSVATFSRAKRITETYMVGQNGSVIEDYGFEPWNIRIQGLIIKGDKQLVGGANTVEEQVEELQSYEELSDAIKLKGDVFKWLGIHEAAILSITYPEARNFNMEIVKPYEMTLRSVEPIELIQL